MALIRPRSTFFNRARSTAMPTMVPMRGFAPSVTQLFLPSRLIRSPVDLLPKVRSEMPKCCDQLCAVNAVIKARIDGSVPPVRFSIRSVGGAAAATSDQRQVGRILSCQLPGPERGMAALRFSPHRKAACWRLPRLCRALPEPHREPNTRRWCRPDKDAVARCRGRHNRARPRYNRARSCLAMPGLP